MTPAVEATRARVRWLLAEAGVAAEDEGDDTLAVDHHGRRLRLDVLPLGGEESAIQVLAPLVVGVVASDALCEAVAGAHLSIGKFLVLPDDDGTCTVAVVYRFVGDAVAAEVLAAALDVVAAVADDLDPDLESLVGASWTLEQG
jgi:hypothetical protein